jgi:uncharacterized protein YsxB (DUF464 family)
MTTVTVVRSDDGTILGFEAKGHSLAGKSGEDIVCASITILFEYLTRIVEELPDNAITFRQVPDPPHWTLRVNPASLDEDQQYLVEISFDKAEASFRAIGREYSGSCEITERRAED